MTELIVTQAALEPQMARAGQGTDIAPPRDRMRLLLNTAHEGLPDAPEQPAEIGPLKTDTPA